MKSTDLANVRVDIDGWPQSTGVSSATGAVSLSQATTGRSVRLVIRYEAPVLGTDSKGTPLSTPVQVMDDRHKARSESVQVTGTESFGVLQLGIVQIKSLDCDLWNSAVAIVNKFYLDFDAPIPPRELRIKRWDAMVIGGPHTYYDYLVFPTDYMTSSERPGFDARRCTVFHEFGHLLRFSLDGDKTHFDGDVLAYGYAREHGGPELANVHYAFNEGWGDYWERRFGPGCGLGVGPEAKYRDWNENTVAARLVDLDAMLGVGPRTMLHVLKANPGKIHSLHDFEVALHTLVPAAVPQPADVDECPAGFINEMASTCRRDEAVAKPSQTRGSGSPMICAPGMEKDGALCYPTCPAGMSGVGPVCWGSCPAGYRNDGATCFRDADITSADNSACPWYDKCGLTFSKSCSKCPAGFSNDGCTCRIDAHADARPSTTRGAGVPLNACPAGSEQSGQLCYPTCPVGMTGSGPVCWGHCPANTHDNGPTCGTLILIK